MIPIMLMIKPMVALRMTRTSVTVRALTRQRKEVEVKHRSVTRELSSTLIASDFGEDEDSQIYLKKICPSLDEPKKPDRTSAKVRISMPDAYMYGLSPIDEHDSDTERVVITVVSRVDLS